MASPSRMEGDYDFPGNVQFTGTTALPDLTVTDAKVSATAAIAQTKVIHRHVIHYSQPTNGVVVLKSEVVHIAYRASTILDVSIIPDTAPTGGDLLYTVDVKKSTAAGAWASILSSAYSVTAAKADRTVYAATLSGTPTLIADDALQVVIAVAGSTGTQGYGVCVVITLYENAS